MIYRERIVVIGSGLSVLAPAKINLSLLIAGKRDDGFHEIETVMSKISFYDEILIQKGRKSGIEFICKGPVWSPEGKENLVYQAAEMLLESCGIEADITITLIKKIPAGSGLGSASSDAAATLIGLSRYLRLNIDKDSLAKLAERLGSDVAFFLDGPLALCTGKGEKVKKIEEKFNFLALLILPGVNISTERVYANYTHDESLYMRLKERINDHIWKNRIDLLTKECVNMLESSCLNLEKDLAEFKDKIELLNIGPCCLSGSGSAFVCMIESGDEEKAIEYKRKVEDNLGCNCMIVRNNRW